MGRARHVLPAPPYRCAGCSNHETALQVCGRGSGRKSARRAPRSGPSAWPDFFSRCRNRLGRRQQHNIDATSTLLFGWPDGDHHRQQPVAGCQVTAARGSIGPSHTGTPAGSYCNPHPASTRRSGRAPPGDRRGGWHALLWCSSSPAGKPRSGTSVRGGSIAGSA